MAMHSRARCRRSRRGLTLLELLVVLVVLMALATMMVPMLSWMGERSQRFATQENLGRIRELLANQYFVDMGELPRPRAALTGSSGTRLNHPQLVYLFVNPDTHEDGNLDNDFQVPTTILSGRKWQGPYIQHSGAEYFPNVTNFFTTRYGLDREDLSDPTRRIGDPTIWDAWGHPIVIQEPNIDNDPDVLTDIERQHSRVVSAGRDGILQTPPDELMPTRQQRGDDQMLFIFRHDEGGSEFLNLDPS